jgi:RNA polymerase sigma-70 factor (ECF subfamily)
MCNVAIDLASLIAEHHADVYRYAFRLSGVEADAEDLTQQTFLLAQQRLHQLRDPDRVRGWLFAIARSCYLKSQRKRIPLPAGTLELDVDEIPDHVGVNEIDSQLLQAAIDELPDEFKVVLVMFYFEDCSYKEIAAQLVIPIGTVMSRLGRAKGHLRRRLLSRRAGLGAGEKTG